MCDIDFVNCKLIKNKRHLLQDARILPCFNTACFKCIVKAMNKTNYLKCNFQNCRDRHTLIDLKMLPINHDVNDYIKNNIKDVTNYLIIKQGTDLFDDLKEKTENEVSYLESRLDDALNEVDIKMESIKNDLNILVDSIEFSLDIVQEAILNNHPAAKVKKSLKKNSINKQTANYMLNLFKILEVHFKSYETEIQRNFQELNDYNKLYQRKASASHSNSTIKIRNMISCEKLVKIFENMIKYDEIIISKIFSESQSALVCRKIGRFIDPTMFSINSIENATVTVLKLNEIVEFKSIKGLCELDRNELLISDSKSNTINVFDMDFKIKSRKRLIQNNRFEYPHGMCFDGVNVCICDHNNNRVIITDDKLEIIKLIFGSAGVEPGKFDCPIEACYFNSTLFILDRGNKRIQEFTTDGKLIRVLKLYKLDNNNTSSGEVEIMSLTFPLSFKMTNNRIAVLNLSKIYIYDFKGSLLQTLAPNNFTCILFFNESLFAFSNDGYLSCYSKYSTGTDLVENYSYRFEKLKGFQISSMNLFNSSVVFCSDMAKVLAYF